jgi:hypothetical protein
MPTGTVTFTYSNAALNLTGTLGPGPVTLSGGQAALTTSSLPVNINTITASYSGDTNFTSSQATMSQTVQYQQSGTCYGDVGHTILQPINADGTSVFKMGGTVPTKFRVCDYSGNSVGPTAATPNVVKSYLIAGYNGNVNTVDENVTSTTPDTAFRWDSTSQQWIFNTKTGTGNLAVKGTYWLQITLADGTIIGSSGTNGTIPKPPFQGDTGYQYGLR